ncbi:coil containing protein [Vibrio phage 1.090.B._10N.286.48.F1]|nr:coil containing protein [Vibrio phage 1.090.B._10N.286.48.F1]
MSKLVQFKEANLAKLESKWNALENQEDYTPSYEAGYNSGFTHFVASEFCNHDNQSGEYVHV